jgi:1,4-alpha-glucan branching enzyme
MTLATHLVDVETPNLFALKQTAFVLWRPLVTRVPPRLVIGTFVPGNPPTLGDERELELERSPDFPDLWRRDAIASGLVDGQAYHYWFEVTDSSPFRNGQRILCTDPTAFTVDWRLLSPGSQNPASVVKFANGRLVSCDPSGELVVPVPRGAVTAAAPNNRLVIYELPTAWAKINVHGDPQIGVGTFRDVRALVDEDVDATNFAGSDALRVGRSHLAELGVNALEVLPPADSFVEREWGYATSNYFAPDHDLGFPEGNASPTPHADLVALVRACHDRDIRFFADMVMAFATRGAMEAVNYPEFHIDAHASPGDPDAQQSSGQGIRDGFGGQLWRYARPVVGYDPVTGASGSVVPARQLMKAYLLRWMSDFAIDGIRMDSVNNVANWDFVEEFKDLARRTWLERDGSDDRFLVVGEELSVPLDLLRQNRLDGLWNEDFKRIVRNAILGRNDDEEPTFEWSVRRMIDCRLLGFADGAQAVNYVGSHDVEGFRNERLFNFLQNNRIVFTEERIKLAFACLLTAVGIPMIFAGDEFADQHDLSVTHPPKQRDAVNFDRLADPFRRRVFDYVSRLVRFRTSYEALTVNETDFIHVDFNDSKRVLVWRRGRPDSDRQVVVLANFSDFVTANATSPSAEYRVPNWPATPAGMRWREITQDRDVPDEWIGREPIFPWEAKVYALVDAAA